MGQQAQFWAFEHKKLTKTYICQFERSRGGSKPQNGVVSCIEFASSQKYEDARHDDEADFEFQLTAHSISMPINKGFREKHVLKDDHVLYGWLLRMKFFC